MTEYVYPLTNRPIIARKNHTCWACEGEIKKGEEYSRELHASIEDGLRYKYLNMHAYCRYIVDTYGYLFRDRATFLVQPFKHWENTYAAKKKDLPVQLKDFLTIVMDFDI